MQQDEVDMAFSHPGVMLGSDGTLSEGQGHPRAAGAFPRFFSRYVKSGKLSLHEAVKRLSTMPAKQLGLKNKGRLDVGADADITIFDYASIQDGATFQDPALPPMGIDYVFIGGELAAKDCRIVKNDLGKSVRK
jgi:N-acyl-D-amino-acid deacylase